MAKKKRYPQLFVRHASPYLYFHWRDQFGHRHERTTRKKVGDEEAAEQVRLAFVHEIATGHEPSSMESWTLSQATQSWLDFRIGRVARGTWGSEKSITSALLAVLGTDTKLRTLADIQHIQDYQSARLKAGIKSKSINNEVLVIKGILERADLWQRVAPRYKKLKSEKADVGEALTREECKRLIRYAGKASPEAVAPYTALLSLGSGLRDWEIKSLKLGDVHLEDAAKPHVYVRRATTKSDAGARFVVLDPIATWAIQRLVSRAHRLGSNDSDDFLLPGYMPAHTRSTDPLRGKGTDFDPAHHQTCWEWDIVRKDTSLEHRRFHDLRHSFISRAGEAGVPLPVLMQQVGHMSRSTLAIYMHVSDRALFDAAQRIGSSSGELIAELESSPARHQFEVVPGGKRKGLRGKRRSVLEAVAAAK